MAVQDTGKIEIAVPRDLRVVYWGLLGLAVLVTLLSLTSHNGPLAFVPGCFLGIAARIVQAEHHHRELRAARVTGAGGRENAPG